jgi:hypothetical protein
MHKSAPKCNETVGKWNKNKYGASKIIDTLETYQSYLLLGFPTGRLFTSLTPHHQASFLAPLPGRKKTSAKEVSHAQSFTLFIILLYFIFDCIVLSKNTKN